jgi:cytochrome c oxidase assembly protein subunit 15
VAAHLIAGNGFACATLLLSLAFRSRARMSAHAPSPAPFPSASGLWIAAAACLLLVQLGIGGLVSSRYAAMACPEWPTCSGGVWFPSWSGSVGLHVVHRLTAYTLVGCLALAAAASWREPRLRAPTALACMLGVLQLGVGIANVLLGVPAALTAAHTGVAAAIALSLTYALHACFELRAERRALGLPAIRARC